MVLTASPAPRLRGVAHPSAPQLKPLGEAYALDCPDCLITGHPLIDREATAYLTQIHNRLHHADEATATTVPVSSLCEACGHAPATLTVPDPDPGAGPFAVCTACALDPDGRHTVQCQPSETADRRETPRTPLSVVTSSAAPQPVAYGVCHTDDCPSALARTELADLGPADCPDCTMPLRIEALW